MRIYQQHHEPSVEICWNSHARQEYVASLKMDPPSRKNSNDFSPVNRDLVNWVTELLGRIGMIEIELIMGQGVG